MIMVQLQTRTTQTMAEHVAVFGRGQWAISDPYLTSTLESGQNLKNVKLSLKEIA